MQITENLNDSLFLIFNPVRLWTNFFRRKSPQNSSLYTTSAGVFPQTQVKKKRELICFIRNLYIKYT